MVELAFGPTPEGLSLGPPACRLPPMKLKTFLIALSLVCLCLLIPSVAFAADGAAAVPTVTWGMVLAAALGFLTMAYNTGSVFGFKTVPKPMLPYIGLAITFGAGFSQVLGQSSLSFGGVELALLAGFNALLGNATGAAAHSFFTAQKSSRGAAATVAAGGSPPPGSALSIRPSAGVTPAASANDTVPPESPKASAYRGLPLPGHRVSFFSIAFKRVLRRMIPVTVIVGVFAIGASTGATCNATVSPQSQAEIQAAIALGDCMESTYATDSQKIPPASAEQIVIDEGITCAPQAAQLAELFAASSDPGKVAVAKVAKEHPELLAQGVAKHQSKTGH